MKTSGCIILAVSVAASAWAAPYVLRKDGSRVDGVRIRANTDGTIVLTTANGQMQFPKGQYAQAFADKPAELDGAVAAALRTPDQAIPVLKKLAEENRYLEWDKSAVLALGKACLSRKDYPTAITAFETLFNCYAGIENEGEYGQVYLQVLLGAGQTKKLEERCAKMAASGSPSAAARAHLIRGDMRMAENKVEYAVREYLRVVLFYDREKDVMPEALSKAAGALEKSRDPRAKQLYQQLVRDYPNSPEAAVAKKKI